MAKKRLFIVILAVVIALIMLSIVMFIYSRIKGNSVFEIRYTSTNQVQAIISKQSFSVYNSSGAEKKTYKPKNEEDIVINAGKISNIATTVYQDEIILDGTNEPDYLVITFSIFNKNEEKPLSVCAKLNEELIEFYDVCYYVLNDNDDIIESGDFEIDSTPFINIESNEKKTINIKLQVKSDNKNAYSTVSGVLDVSLYS